MRDLSWILSLVRYMMNTSIIAHSFLTHCFLNFSILDNHGLLLLCLLTTSTQNSRSPSHSYCHSFISCSSTLASRKNIIRSQLYWCRKSSFNRCFKSSKRLLRISFIQKTRRNEKMPRRRYDLYILNK